MVKSERYVVGLDIGTTKISCIVGEVQDSGDMQVVGIGEAASRDLSRKVDVAVVTDGVRGAFISQREKTIHVRAHSVEVVDTTGAGDCFAAGFLAGLVRGESLAVCGELATLLAANAISHLGVKLSADIEEQVEMLLRRP